MKDNSYRSFIVPAGKYWLLDPYRLFDLDDPRATELAFKSACGAQTYDDQHGNSYSTDTGTLGLVPLEYAPDYDPSGYGLLLDFDAETLCFTKDGILTFGNYIIDTAKECMGFVGTDI